MARSLVTAMLNHDHQLRPGIDAILRHPYFQSHGSRMLMVNGLKQSFHNATTDPAERCHLEIMFTGRPVEEGSGLWWVYPGEGDDPRPRWAAQMPPEVTRAFPLRAADSDDVYDRVK
jgi:hypothetical protein